MVCIACEFKLETMGIGGPHFGCPFLVNYYTFLYLRFLICLAPIACKSILSLFLGCLLTHFLGWSMLLVCNLVPFLLLGGLSARLGSGRWNSKLFPALARHAIHLVPMVLRSPPSIFLPFLFLSSMPAIRVPLCFFIGWLTLFLFRKVFFLIINLGVLNARYFAAWVISVKKFPP